MRFSKEIVKKIQNTTGGSQKETDQYNNREEVKTSCRKHLYDKINRPKKKKKKIVKLR